jgi:hypothetical protein
MIDVVSHFIIWNLTLKRADLFQWICTENNKKAKQYLREHGWQMTWQLAGVVSLIYWALSKRRPGNNKPAHGCCVRTHVRCLIAAEHVMCQAQTTWKIMQAGNKNSLLSSISGFPQRISLQTRAESYSPVFLARQTHPGCERHYYFGLIAQCKRA